MILSIFTLKCNSKVSWVSLNEAQHGSLFTIYASSFEKLIFFFWNARCKTTKSPFSLIQILHLNFPYIGNGRTSSSLQSSTSFLIKRWWAYKELKTSIALLVIKASSSCLSWRILVRWSWVSDKCKIAVIFHIKI